MKKLLVLLAVLVGAAFAIAPATSWTAGTPAKYSQTPASAIITEGGNITEVNITQAASTEKWAGFWGNLDGALYLAPDTTHIFYQWNGFDITDSTLCALTIVSGFDWGSVQSGSASAVDTLWSFTPSDADSAANTFTGTTDIQVAGTTVNNAPAADTGATGGFLTGILADTASPAAKGDVAFCVTANNDQTLFNGQTGDYELMVPTPEAPGATESYYFWVELH